MSLAVHQVAEGLHFIERGWLNGNHLAFTGPGTVLVDSAYLGGLDETLEGLAACGVAIPEVELIVTTHVHCDHVGAHAHIHQRSGCRIALHATSRRIIEARDGRANWSQFYGQRYQYFPCHQSLEHGQVLRINHLDWQVIHTPGHASGMICLYAPDTGWLISADAVWDGDFGVLTTQVEGLAAPAEHLESLRRLARLNISLILPGHGPIIDQPEAALERCLTRAQAFVQRPELAGQDQMRKILLYHLLMHPPMDRAGLANQLKQATWFQEACQQYFEGKQEQTLHQYLDDLMGRGLIQEDQGRLIPLLPA